MMGEAGSYSRLMDFVYHSTLGVRVMKKRRGVMMGGWRGATTAGESGRDCPVQGYLAHKKEMGGWRDDLILCLPNHHDDKVDSAQ